MLGSRTGQSRSVSRGSASARAVGTRNRPTWATVMGCVRYSLVASAASVAVSRNTGWPSRFNKRGPAGANERSLHRAVNQTDLLRWNYGDPSLGTCTETIKGGSHFRYWTQNGTAANSGAYFMAISYEKNLTFQHDVRTPPGAVTYLKTDIIRWSRSSRMGAFVRLSSERTGTDVSRRRYDIGRDEFIGNATAAAGTTSPLTGKIYHTTSIMQSHLPANSSAGINHNIETDGLVAIFTVKVQAGSGTSTASTSSSSVLIRVGWELG